MHLLASEVNLRAPEALVVLSVHWSSVGSAKPRLATKPLRPHKQSKVVRFPKPLNADLVFDRFGVSPFYNIVLFLT